MSDLDYIPQMFGPVRSPTAMPLGDFAALEARVPATLVQFWRDHGVGIYGGGLLHMCNPVVFDPLVDVLFEGDADFAPAATSVYAFTPFATLYLWNQVHGALMLFLLDGGLSAPGLIHPEQRHTPAIDLAASIFSFSAERADLHDDSDKPLFARAVKELGEQALDECFGFVPALSLGGERRLENLRRVKALEHFLILAQVGEVVLKDFSSLSAQPIRPIGQG